MIKDITLRNLQGHKFTHIELEPGVNVISGTSDVGKSSIVRGLRWLISNKPSAAGEAWRFWGADKKEAVAVTVTLDNGTVTRFRKGSKNGYQIKGPQGGACDELVAIRSDVPREVSDMLDLGEHNLQTQHRVPGSNPYFLVEDSPADVARKLNDVCGLYIIDVCLKNVTTLVSKIVQLISESKRRIEDLVKSGERYAQLGVVDKAVGEVENAARQLESVTVGVKELGEVVGILRGLQGKIDSLDEFLGIEEHAAPLWEQLAELTQLEGQREELRGWVEQGRLQEKEIEELDASILESEEEFHVILQDAGVCPFCNQEIR